MICPECDRDIQPAGLPTGLQELLAYRIHVARDHGIYKGTVDAMAIRMEAEREARPPRFRPEVLTVDVDKEEHWLEPRASIHIPR